MFLIILFSIIIFLFHVGAIYIESMQGEGALISDCTFEKNIAIHATAIYFLEGALCISNSDFSENLSQEESVITLVSSFTEANASFISNKFIRNACGKNILFMEFVNLLILENLFKVSRIKQ